MKLIRAEVDLIEAALQGDEALSTAIGYPVVPGWATFKEALRMMRDSLAADPARVEWGPRFFVDGEPDSVVGWGGFKGPPVDGTVEIGYEIAAGVQGRGFATAAARAMVIEAFASPEVEMVIAHTLAEPNASNHILEKLGFQKVATVMDDNQPVWRYELECPQDPEPPPLT
jgi:RimJ/RimL family protein N-acetyltransferase